MIDQIYALSEPYWQVRANEIHVPGSFAFAKTLLAAHPTADPEIVLAAILLHDNGYAVVPPDSLLQGLQDAPTGFDGKITRLHEEAGVVVARQILAEVGMEAGKTAVICHIINGHDSRPEATSLEDALVKDADKLWRFCPDGVRIASGWMAMPATAFLAYVEQKIERWFFTATAKTMAWQLAAETREQWKVYE